MGNVCERVRAKSYSIFIGWTALGELNLKILLFGFTYEAHSFNQIPFTVTFRFDQGEIDDSHKECHNLERRNNLTFYDNSLTWNGDKNDWKE